jgi:hypothetical protein
MDNNINNNINNDIINNNLLIEYNNDASETIAYILIFVFILVTGIILIIYAVKKYNLQLFNRRSPPPTPIPTPFTGTQNTGIYDDDVDLSGNCSKRPLYDSDFFKKIYNNTDNTLVFY